MTTDFFIENDFLINQGYQKHFMKFSVKDLFSKQK